MKQRDMTRAQFHAALERNGFSRPEVFWTFCKETSTGYPLTFVAKTGKIARRSTLAHVIARRDEDRERLARYKAYADAEKDAGREPLNFFKWHKEEHEKRTAKR